MPEEPARPVFATAPLPAAVGPAAAEATVPAPGRGADKPAQALRQPPPGGAVAALSVFADEASRGGVPFLDRRRRQCAWPLWDDATPRSERTVCGAPTLPGPCSWCARHAHLAWAPEPAELPLDTSRSPSGER